MGWTVKNSFVTEGGGGSTSILGSVSSVALNDLIVLFGGCDTATAMSVSDASDTFSSAAMISNGVVRTQPFYALQTNTSGTVNFTLTYTSSVLGRFFAGVVATPTASAVFDQTTSNTFGSSVSTNSANIPTTRADDLIIGYVYNEAGFSVVAQAINGAAVASSITAGPGNVAWLTTTAAMASSYTAQLSAASRATNHIIAFNNSTVAAPQFIPSTIIPFYTHMVTQ